MGKLSIRGLVFLRCARANEAVFNWIPRISSGNYLAVASMENTYLIEDFEILPEKVEDELADEIARLTDEIEDALNTISDLESQIQELEQDVDNLRAQGRQWQQYTYLELVIAVILLILLLYYIRK